jgi:MFS family permease
MHRNRLDPKVSVSIVFVSALFMSIMDTTIVNVALPSLARQLGVPSTSIDAPKTLTNQVNPTILEA